MAALDRLPPTQRIRRALEVTAKLNMGVCAPFHIRSMLG
jgi:hypothetical protein